MVKLEVKLEVRVKVEGIWWCGNDMYGREMILRIRWISLVFHDTQGVSINSVSQEGSMDE